MASRTPPATASVLPETGRDSQYRDLVFALVAVWGIGDAVSTLTVLALAGDVAFEANPLVRALVVQHPALVLALKAVVALVVGGLLLACRDTVQRAPLWRPWLFGVLAAGVVVVTGNVYVGVLALA